jgi:Txe/YoeB family toxin of Txe-Axe toxin-antitoxin module
MTVKSCAARSALPGKPHQAVLQPQVIADLKHRVAADRNVAFCLIALVEAVLREPFAEIDNPGPLMYLSPGAWIRCLAQEHGIVQIDRDEQIDALQGCSR